MAILTEKQIRKMGFKYIGKNVRISNRASFYNVKEISIGDNTRIDDFAVISAGEGGIYLGRNIHISVYTSLIGKGRITVGDFATISSRVSIFSSNDDYSGEFMTNPTVTRKLTNVTHGDVAVSRHVIIGSGSIILPNVVLEEGVCIGALSLVKENCTYFGVYAGVPARFIKKRSKKLLNLAKEVQ